MKFLQLSSSRDMCTHRHTCTHNGAQDMSIPDRASVYLPEATDPASSWPQNSWAESLGGQELQRWDPVPQHPSQGDPPPT